MTELNNKLLFVFLWLSKDTGALHFHVSEEKSGQKSWAKGFNLKKKDIPKLTTSSNIISWLLMFWVTCLSKNFLGF